MDKLIRKSESKAFSGEDLHKLIDGKGIVRRYRELADFRSIWDALGKHRAMILLYETKPNYGHWCLIMEISPGVLEFFDPYGMPVDSQLEFIPPAFRPPPYLSGMIDRSSRCQLVVYNNVALQEFTKRMNTCGRWCGIRLAMRDVPIKNFIGLFEGQSLAPDALATLLTEFV